MTDVATETLVAPAASDTPAETPITPAAETPLAEEARGPLSRREAKSGLRQDRTVEPAVEIPAGGAEPAVGGAEPLVGGAEPAVGGADPAAGGAAPAVTPPVEAVAPIVVPIPADHPLRKLGIQELTAKSPLEERGIRAMLNSYVRRKEVDERDHKIAMYEEKIARRDAQEAADQKWRSTPGYQSAVERYTELKEAYGEDVANQFWRGVSVEYKQIEDTEYQTRIGAIKEEREQAAAETWAQQAWQNQARLPEPIRTLPDFPRWFQNATLAFNAELERGAYPEAQNDQDLHAAFGKFFSARLVAEPAVVAAFKGMETSKQRQSQAATEQAAAKQREREAIEKAAVEKAMKEIAAKRQGSPLHPLGNLPASAGRDRLPAESNGDVETDLSKMTPHQLRKAQREASRLDSRRRLAPS